MKTLITLTFVLASVLSFAQTDIIEMRSRNASLKKYERTTKSNNFDHVASNFGMLPPDEHWKQHELIEVKYAVLDSVKIITENKAIMYTSNYCTPDILPEPRGGTKWAPGMDTVVNHPLFSQRHSLDSIKSVIDRDYSFYLPSDSTAFIGFDNVQGQSNMDSIEPVKHKRPKENSIGWELIFMLITPMLFAFSVNRFVLPMSSNSK